MKKTVFLILCLFAAMFYSLSSSYASDGRCCNEEFPRISVQGEANMEVLADKAYFNIRIRQEEKKIDQAIKESSKKINSLNDTLAAFGVKKEDIRNLGYTYHPLYEGKQLFSSVTKPTSYEVLYSLKITVYNIDKLGEIFATLSDIKETTVYGLTFTSSKIDELKRDILKEAAKDAKERAKRLAEGSGANLGKLLQINSNAQEMYQANRVVLTRGYVAKEMNMAMDSSSSEASMQTESGYIEIVGQCDATYLIQ